MQGAPTPAPAPDPVKTAQAQSASNKETAIAQYGLNATNQVTPNGTLTYTQNGTWPDGTPKFTATTALSPEQQKLQSSNLQTQQGLADIGNEQIQRVGQALDKPVDFGPNLSLNRLDLGAPLNLDTDATEARTMDLARKRLDPIQDQQDEATKAQLFNSGIMPGTEAYRRAMTQRSQDRNDAYNQLILGGHSQAVNDITTQYQAGQQQKQAEYGADTAATQAEYTAREQQTAAQRNQMFNEIASLLNGSQIQLPQFTNTPTPGIAPTDVIGAQQQALNQQNVGFNAAQQNYQGMMNGLFGLGKTALGGLTTPALGGWGLSPSKAGA